MGLFDFLFKRQPKPAGKYDGFFKMLDGYTPHFTNFGGSLYESEIIRAVINAKATHISKLRIELMGAAKPELKNRLKHAPNSLQTWSQFLYRADTLLEVHNTLFIVPILDKLGQTVGIYAPLPHKCEVVDYGGVPYLRYEFAHGETAAIELSRCGIMTKFQYKSDLFGETNHALYPTMDLISIQNQGIQEGVKSAASYRFMAQLSNFSKAEDLAKERQRFTEENFARDAKAGGLLLFPNTYANIKQIDAKPWVIDSEQMTAIKEGVFDYFGINEDVLQSRAYGDKWTAFYESAIEPWAIQFSEVVSRMLFTDRELTEGNEIMATANRLQYLSNAEKLNVSAQMLDRGIISINDAREIWNLPPVEGGDVRVIRGEYWNADEKVSEQTEGENDA